MSNTNKKENWNHLPPYDVDKYSTSYCFETADIVLFSVIDGELNVLLVKRGSQPFFGYYALPGGFKQIEDEDVGETAMRELKEETGLENIYLEQLETFTKKGRDPRELVATSPIRITSVAHLAIIDYTKVNAIAGSDADEVKWFKISELPELAFDHAKIIDKAINRVRNKINYTNIGFELVPEFFTIPELRKVFESVLGRKINPTNFRTKILKLKILKTTKKKRVEGKGQPAPVYTLDKEKFNKLTKTETLFN